MFVYVFMIEDSSDNGNILMITEMMIFTRISIVLITKNILTMVSIMKRVILLILI